MISKKEVETFRLPSAYLEWFEGLLLRIREDPDLKEPARRHEGFFKNFYEEMFPLRSLLKVKGDKWKLSEFKNVFGSQAYDVEIRNNELKYLEVVITDFDDGELFRLKHLSERKSVDAIAPIIRNARGRPVGFENEGGTRLRSQLVDEVLTTVGYRLRRKVEISYPKRTGLVIYIDDYKFDFDPDNQPGFSSLLNSTKGDWKRVFETVFVVGPRAESWIEMS